MNINRTMTLIGVIVVATIVIAIMLPAGMAGRTAQRYQEDGVPGLLRMAANRLDTQPRFSVRPPIENALEWLGERPSMTIVQVGAYIGDTYNDPLFDFLQAQVPKRVARGLTTKIVLVEPIQNFFDQLVVNYAGLPGVAYERVAIAEDAGFVDMYRLDVDPTDYGYPEWVAQMSALKNYGVDEWDKLESEFNSNQWAELSEIAEFYKEHRVLERVKSVTLHQLLEKHGLEDHLDLLQMDIEGYDCILLKTLDFERIKPRFINYESGQLGEEGIVCRQMLSDHGYVLFEFGPDTLAVLAGSD